ncbi:MAG TPA: DUF1320 family protein [Candidatus Kapabacteria bacterium]|nr:DUF1320 family protein [Candidatus Kapabacteria bacterium]
MAYITKDDLLIEFAVHDLSKLTGNKDGITINLDRLNLCCEMATTEVNANLSNLYELPFTIVPDIIKNISYEFSVYYLYSSYYTNMEIPEQVKWRKINANNTLRMIKKGEALVNPTITNNRIITRNTNLKNEFELTYLREMSNI